jgi:Xaa-Pro dipeptidase
MKFVPDRDGLAQLTAAKGLDALVAMSPENFTYLTGAYILTVSKIRPRQAFAVLPAKAPAFAVICKIEESLTRLESWITDLTTYIEFKEVPVEVLAEALTKAGLATGRIGMDLDYLPASSYLRLIELLPQATLVNTTEEIAAIRSVKTATEIDLLETTTKQTHRAVLDAMAASTLGDTERQMADRIATNLITYGADGTLFMCFASGERTPQPHTIADPNVIPKEGEIIRFDIGGTYGAYASDFARTYSAGSPSNLQKHTYTALLEAQEATINAVAPGVLAEDLFYLCVDEFKKRGIAFHMPHIGHSFGVELHETPMLRPGDKTPLKPGMVINIEPGTRDEEGSAYHSEDLLVVTETGFRLLTLGTAPKELPVIGQTITY